MFLPFDRGWRTRIVLLCQRYMKFPNNDISFCKMLAWFGISLVFPDEVGGLPSWAELVYLPGSDFDPISRTRVWIIVLGSGFRPFSRTRSGACLPGRSWFTYLVLILARFPEPGSGLLYLVRDFARFPERGRGFAFLVRDYAHFPGRGQGIVCLVREIGQNPEPG